MKHRPAETRCTVSSGIASPGPTTTASAATTGTPHSTSSANAPSTPRWPLHPRRPAFFIVGGPKCGTTALQSYLSASPRLFLPRGKEFHHFAPDLLPPERSHWTRERYLSLFRRATDDQLCGETSVFHLYSRVASQEIRRFEPAARIIVLVRNPVDVLHALHSQLVYNGDEPIADFEEALAAEPRRRRGLDVPPRIPMPRTLWYRDVVRFAEQIERYRSTFEHVYVIVYDDLAADTARVYDDVLRFLGLEPGVRPDFRIVNSNKRVRSRLVRDALHSPPEAVKVLARALLPRPLRDPVRRLVRRINTRYVERPPLPPALRRELIRELEPEVCRLEDLLGRSLTSWRKETQK